MPRGCLQFVIVVFPDQTHLLLLKKWKQKQTKAYVYQFELKVEVFYKHKLVEIFQFFKKIHQF